MKTEEDKAVATFVLTVAQLVFLFIDTSNTSNSMSEPIKMVNDAIKKIHTEKLG